MAERPIGEVQDSGYLSHFESEHTPLITWQEMIEEGKVIGPNALIMTLRDARHFLINESGPNQQRRRELSRGWFATWQGIIRRNYGEVGFDDPTVRCETGIITYDNLSTQLNPDPAKGLLHRRSGILFLAGGEGHEGHRSAATYMSRKVDQVVWAFEQESYFDKKVRGGSFLSLPIRMSMWYYHPDIDFVTVLPERSPDVEEHVHYDIQFERSGADYYFVDETDPYLNLKIKRGKGDIDVIIPHLDVPSTTERVRRLMHEPSLEEFLYDWHLHRLPKINESIFVT